MTDRTDNFNRTDSSTSLGTPSDSGSAWVAHQGTWGISSNQGYNVSNGDHDIASLEASVSDCDIQVTTSVAPTNGDAGPSARVANASNWLDWVTLPGFNLVIMYKNVAGSITEFGRASHTPAAGDVLKFSVSGSTLNGYMNGTLMVGPITDSAGLTNTKHGLQTFRSVAAVRFDDFSITGTGGGGATFNPGWASGATRTIGMGVF